jgi:cytochrome P450
MLAGYDTTSNALSYSSYVLATHPEEQAKLQEEIDQKFGANVELNDEIDYESVNDLPYLDMFIKEVLRMYPLANK